MDFPKTFKDKKGREWSVHIGLVANARLRSAGIPLEEFVPMPSSKMAANPPDLSELIDLLHGTFNGIRAVTAILQSQLQKLGITEEAFLEDVDDEAIIADMGRALYQAIIDFFQKSPLRQSLVKKAWKDGQALMAAAARGMDRAMNREDVTAQIATMESQIDAEIAKIHEAGKNSAISTPV